MTTVMKIHLNMPNQKNTITIVKSPRQVMKAVTKMKIRIKKTKKGNAQQDVCGENGRTIEIRA